MASQEITHIIIASSIILVLFGIFLFSIMMLYEKRKKEYKQGLVAQQEAFGKELLQSRLEIQEQTFKTISQEIHDNIGQVLSLAKLNLNTLDGQDWTKSNEKILDAKTLVSKAIQDLRDLSKTLSPDTIAGMGLIRAVEIELILIQKTGASSTELTVIGHAIRTDPQRELILFRIVQEALHNIIKHAQATKIQVIASFLEDRLVLNILDDGIGFDTAQASGSGSGLQNMQSRSHLIGAMFHIETSSNEGTKIQINLPIKH